MDSPSCVQTPSGLGPPVVTLTASVTLWHHQRAERGFRGQAQKWHTSRHPHSTGQSSGMGTPLPARGAGEQAAVSPGAPTHRLCHKSPSPVVTASLKLLLIPQKSPGSGPPLPRGASSQSEKSTEAAASDPHWPAGPVPQLPWELASALPVPTEGSCSPIHHSQAWWQEHLVRQLTPPCSEGAPLRRLPPCQASPPRPRAPFTFLPRL